MTGDLDSSDDLEAFAQLAGQALRDLDPPPSSASQLARIAFDFRDVPTIDDLIHEQDLELAGIRGAIADEGGHASDGTTSLAWKIIDEDTIVGAVEPPEGRTLELQSAAGRSDVLLDDDGSFEVELTESTFRFIVSAPEGSWATRWSIR